jgi:D-alanyl-D-alanine carboxypeptidase/D-alanyl-D-alanine-endopeptidase (penicillin-binding protein 4)
MPAETKYRNAGFGHKKENNQSMRKMNAYSTYRLAIGYYLLCVVLFSACSVSSTITKEKSTFVFLDSLSKKCQVGIAVYDVDANEYLYQKDAEKYFIPSSNAKLFTLYAGMKYLGDSIVGLAYRESNDTVFIQPTADPTFLHEDFQTHPTFEFLKSKKNIVVENNSTKYLFESYGSGWMWDDYNTSYMPERSAFPVYGNMLRFYSQGKQIFSLPSVHQVLLDSSTDGTFTIQRDLHANHFYLNYTADAKPFTTAQVPFITSLSNTVSFLKDTLKNTSIFIVSTEKANSASYRKIYSQISDSLFKKMMHQSDNFFAEQVVLMVSNKRLNQLNDRQILDSILLTDFSDIPQQPRWVDGSGLSRYNLFTPQSMVYILKKLNTDFGWKRIQSILPTGGEGTLKNYYLADSGFFFAKTGSMSNQFAISGYMITAKNKKLIFSVIVNNFMESGQVIRRAVEAYLHKIRMEN